MIEQRRKELLRGVALHRKTYGISGMILITDESKDSVLISNYELEELLADSGKLANVSRALQTVPSNIHVVLRWLARTLPLLVDPRKVS